VVKKGEIMKIFIGVTIGPIHKTLKNAKKTRELWAGSYVFSYIMRRIIYKFQDHNILLPHFDKDMLSNPSKRRGIGMFHDRLMFEKKNTNDDLANLRQVVDDILLEIGKLAGNEEYIKRYFQISWCQIAFPYTYGYKDIVPIMDKALDAVELRKGIIEKEALNDKDDNLITSVLRDYGDHKNGKPSLVKLLFDDSGRKRCRFDSIPKIASRDLSFTIPELDYENFWNTNDDVESEELDPYIEFKNRFSDIPILKHHKYIAIIKADGDNLGDVIKSLKKDVEFSVFSKALFDYALKANDAIQKYGGETIYAGGDDLLFFAPIKMGRQSVFDLIDELSEIYQKTVPGVTTISFGVSISYYKYPLYEALEVATELLFEKAKKYPGKNAVAMRLLKHSGQRAETVFGIGCPFQMIRNLVSNSLNDNPLFNSLTNTLIGQTAVLKEIGTDRERLVNFIDNSFNEEIHKINPEFMKAIVDVVLLVYSDRHIRDKRNALDAILKIASFMQEE
jgi:CRISPR-associated protein Cmr2